MKVAVYANVERILLPSTLQSSRSRLSAIGVVYRGDQMGESNHAMVQKNGGVLLSAGAIGNPYS